MITSGRGWLAVVLVSLPTTALASVADAPSTLRTLTILWFMLLIPGLALAGPLRLRDGWSTLTLAIAISLSLDIVVSGALLYAGAWSPPITLVILMEITLVGVAFSLRQELRDRRAAR